MDTLIAEVEGVFGLSFADSQAPAGRTREARMAAILLAQALTGETSVRIARAIGVEPVLMHPLKRLADLKLRQEPAFAARIDEVAARLETRVTPR